MQSEKVNYSALAGFLSSLPEEIAIRRFRELHVQSLLFYQAELVQLQRELRELEDIDSKLHIEVKDRVNYRWQVPPPSTQGAHANASGASSNAGAPQAPVGGGGDLLLSDYQAKILQIRETLRKYGEHFDSSSRLTGRKTKYTKSTARQIVRYRKAYQSSSQASCQCCRSLSCSSFRVCWSGLGWFLSSRRYLRLFWSLD
jgi:hypothetical protein